ncbi:MAG TPA: succinate dehydrogenase, partial [Verrucomicrobiae bacterium]|nr:succinate dehydrogenase [Verrucomicrobiae bacterium]
VRGCTTRVSESSTAGGLTRFGSTQRRDAWWIENLPFIIVLGAFTVYTTWRAFAGDFYWADPYLSPFYSPLIDPQHHWWPFSPALLILGGPLGFRATCYYYRKAYYRAFFLDPPGCAVGESSGSKYRGETAFPFILQNVHRYFFYIAVIFVAFLWYDAIIAFDFDGKFGIGVGTLVMLVNIILLTIYTFSCHSLRHLMGGKLDCFSCATLGAPRESVWRGITKLNEHHMFWAWVSMISVGLTDLYIRLVASGALKDIRIL